MPFSNLLSALKKDRFAKSAAVLLAVVATAPLLTSPPALAKTLSQSEIKTEMLNKTILTRRFGLRVTMRYKTNGTVSASTVIGSLVGTWRYSGNRVCTTFPSGPAKGTSCVTFRKTGPKRFVSSEGVRFTVR